MLDKNKNIKVSICSLTYNHAPYIRECLDGFLMQKCDFGFEVLIHDDASTDGTIDIIKEYQEKYPEIIKPYIQKENQWSKGVRGMNAKYNFSRAQGKYIALCEGDDYWIDPLKLQKQVDFLEENEEYVLTSHRRKLVDERGREITDPHISKNDYHTQCLVFRNIIKDDFLKFNSNKIINGDTFLVLYLNNYGKSQILDFIGAAYRVSDQGIWSKINANERFKKTTESYQQMISFFSKYGYQKSTDLLKKYQIDAEIIYLKKQGNISIRKYIGLLYKVLLTKDYNRLKSVIRLKL